jgi:hypothetical protein
MPWGISSIFMPSGVEGVACSWLVCACAELIAEVVIAKRCCEAQIAAAEVMAAVVISVAACPFCFILILLLRTIFTLLLHGTGVT